MPRPEGGLRRLVQSLGDALDSFRKRRPTPERSRISDLDDQARFERAEFIREPFVGNAAFEL